MSSEKIGSQVFERLTLQQEIVAERQQDVNVGLEHESSQQLRKPALHIDPVQREQFLCLIDDEERVLVTLAPPPRQQDRCARVFESGKEWYRPRYRPPSPPPAPGPAR